MNYIDATFDKEKKLIEDALNVSFNTSILTSVFLARLSSEYEWVDKDALL